MCGSFVMQPLCRSHAYWAAACTAPIVERSLCKCSNGSQLHLLPSTLSHSHTHTALLPFLRVYCSSCRWEYVHHVQMRVSLMRYPTSQNPSHMLLTRCTALPSRTPQLPNLPPRKFAGTAACMR